MRRLRPASAWPAPLGLLCPLLLAAAPALAGAPQATAFPTSLILGEGRKVEIRVRSGSGDPSALQAECNVGTFTARTVSGEETRFTWAPPEVRYPHTALCLFWVDPGPGGGAPDVAALRLPLLGRMDLEINTEPRADVLVEIGRRTFGPKRADGSGQVKVPIEVPPGVKRARVLSYYGGTSNAVELPLEVPPTNPLLVAAGPDPMPRDDGWLWVFHTGKLDPGKLRVETIGGQARLIDGQEDRALYELTAPPDTQRLAAMVKLPEEPGASASASLKVTERASPALRPPRRRVVGWALGSSALAGGFFGGGSNLGGLLGVEVSLIPPVLDGRLAFGGQLEIRSMSFATTVAGLGTLESWVIGPSLDAVARGTLFEVGPLSLHLRAGAGLLFFSHRLQTGFQPAFNERGVGLDAFGAVQLAYRVGFLDVLLEVRGSVAPVQTTRLDARMGGLILAAGARVF